MRRMMAAVIAASALGLAWPSPAAALEYVEDGMTLGLGSGSTSECFIRALGEALKAGRFRDFQAIATSVQVARLAASLGIPVIPLATTSQIDLAVDGADEVDPALNLIKGLGGALLREKIVEQNARRFIVIVDETKLVPVLGTKGPLPIEVVPFGREAQVGFLRDLGADPVLRLVPGSNEAYLTDNGNCIYHCRLSGIPDPAALDRALHARAGIVETGLFIGMAERVIVARPDRVDELTRP